MLLKEKCFSCKILSTEQISLTDCLYFDTGQYMYFNCVCPRLWCHKFWNEPYLSNQAVSTIPNTQNKILIILRTKRAFKVKPFFISFKRLSVTNNCLRLEGASLKYKLSKISTVIYLKASTKIILFHYNFYHKHFIYKNLSKKQQQNI